MTRKCASVPGEDNNLPPFPWDDVNTLPEETGEKETENADEYMGIILQSLTMKETSPYPL
jgi:hypothetical protein